MLPIRVFQLCSEAGELESIFRNTQNWPLECSSCSFMQISHSQLKTLLSHSSDPLGLYQWKPRLASNSLFLVYTHKTWKGCQNLGSRKQARNPKGVLFSLNIYCDINNSKAECFLKTLINENRVYIINSNFDPSTERNLWDMVSCRIREKEPLC